MSEKNLIHLAAPDEARLFWWLPIVGGVILAACVLWPAFVVVTAGLSETYDIGDWAQFGDAFAPVTSLASALALMAALYAVTLQSGELLLQRKELALTRDEMRQQREAAQDQAKSLKAQLEVQERLVAAQLEMAEAQRESARDYERVELAHMQTREAAMVSQERIAHRAEDLQRRAAELQRFELAIRVDQYEAEVRAMTNNNLPPGVKQWATEKGLPHAERRRKQFELVFSDGLGLLTEEDE